MASKLQEHFSVVGRSFDRVEESANILLREIFPDTSTSLIEGWERVFNLINTGTLDDRRNRIISAMRQRGGVTKKYFEDIGNAQGGSVYNVVLTEGTDAHPFIVAPYSSNTSPQGPATLIPGQVTQGPYTDTPFVVTVIVTGVASAPDLEVLFNRLKPAWIQFVFVYVP